MSPQDIRYGFPEAAYLFFAVPLFLWLFWSLFQYRLRRQMHFASPEILKVILIPRSSPLFWGKSLAFCFAWIFAALALMQPMGYGYYPAGTTSIQSSTHSQQAVRQRKAHEIILLIDASSSMSIADSRNNTTRLSFAKEIADAIVSRLKGQTAALVAFTSQITQLAPPTTDYLFVRQMLRELLINEGGIPGTSLIDALKELRQRFFSEPSTLRKTVVLISDGGDTDIEASQGAEREKFIKRMLEPLEDSERNNLQVFTIGVGSVQGAAIPNISFEGKPVLSVLDADLLQKISKEGRGKYYFANEMSPINLAAEIVNAMGEESPAARKETLEQVTNREDDLVHDFYYQIPLGLAILLLTGVLLLPDVSFNPKSSVQA